MTLTWQETEENGKKTWKAWSDQLLVGWVLERLDGTIYFDATLAVYMKWIAKPSNGVVPDFESGKAHIERCWNTWLTYAGLKS